MQRLAGMPTPLNFIYLFFASVREGFVCIKCVHVTSEMFPRLSSEVLRVLLAASIHRWILENFSFSSGLFSLFADSSPWNRHDGCCKMLYTDNSNFPSIFVFICLRVSRPMSLVLFFSKDFIRTFLPCFHCIFSIYHQWHEDTFFQGGSLVSFCFTFRTSLLPSFCFQLLKSIPGMFPFLHFSSRLRPIYFLKLYFLFCIGV